MSSSQNKSYHSPEYIESLATTITALENKLALTSSDWEQKIQEICYSLVTLEDHVSRVDTTNELIDELKLQSETRSREINAIKRSKNYSDAVLTLIIIVLIFVFIMQYYSKY